MKAFYFVTLLSLLWPLSRVFAEAPVNFNRDIRPILSENCFYCHGFDQNNRKADLRLDTFEGATTDLGGYRAIVPGDASASEIMARIESHDEDEIMPPPETEQSITSAQVETLKRWINQGAEYQEHWSWQTLNRPESPNGETGAAAIDAFLALGWQENQTEPVGPAKPRDLIRRLSFDLRGIPPTAQEVFDFENNPTHAAFTAIRDKWMGDMIFAEHQAVRWLDLVRWADTSGFVSDEPIASGAYRAWIIEAIAKNQPFDQFSIEQLAGDLLPDPTDDQLVASGYNRIVNTNCEAGAIETEQLYKLKGEHVRALGTVWLGLTTGCAECHDHKFDPISARDYYSLAAFFDDLVEAGVYTPGDRREPLHYIFDDTSKSVKEKQLSQQVDELKSEIASLKIADQDSWEKELKTKLKDNKSRNNFAWVPAELPAPRIVEGTFAMTEFEAKAARETVAPTGQFKRHHAAEFLRGYIHTQKQKTDPAKDAWYINVWLDPKNRPEMIGIQVSHGDYGRLGWRTANYETYYWGTDNSGELTKEHTWNNPKRVKRIGDLPNSSGWVQLRIPFKDLIAPVRGQSYEAVGMAWLQTGGRVGWGECGLDLQTDKTTRLALGETAIRKWTETPKNRQIFQSRSEFVGNALLKESDKRDADQKEIVEDLYREWQQPELMAKLRALESQLFTNRARGLPVLVSKQSPLPKTTRILNRGDYQDKSGAVVSAAVPEFLGNLTSPDPTRLDLAEWLFDQGSPLISRVFVNRVWHQYFGRGISESLEDSGTQGDWPSHLDLLNWLAAEFRDSGWNRNHMIKLITSTKAYQLSSKPNSHLAHHDPGNRWQARQGRFRLPAEAIRDSALNAAGLLHLADSVPKQSFFPYQPAAYWNKSDKVMFGSRHMVWATNPNQQQYQRSLYTFWKRQNIHPTMLAFDAPTRQECTAKRNVTNTPGQALALLNDPIFVEAARVLAANLPNANDREKIVTLFERTLQRSPSNQEITIIEKLLQSQRSNYQNAPAEAAKLVGIGQAEAPENASASETAAWTAVTRSILNLHEFLNRP